MRSHAESDKVESVVVDHSQLPKPHQPKPMKPSDALRPLQPLLRLFGLEGGGEMVCERMARAVGVNAKEPAKGAGYRSKQPSEPARRWANAFAGEFGYR